MVLVGQMDHVSYRNMEGSDTTANVEIFLDVCFGWATLLKCMGRHSGF